MLKLFLCKPFNHHLLTQCYSQNVKDYYQILGLKRSSSAAEIKEAYYKLSKQYHPDLNPENSSAAYNFREITEAYEILTNVFSKSAYDASYDINQRSSFQKKPSSIEIKIREEDYTHFYRQRKQSHSTGSQQFHQNTKNFYKKKDFKPSYSIKKEKAQEIQKQFSKNESKNEKSQTLDYQSSSFIILSVFFTIMYFTLSVNSNVNNDLKKMSIIKK